jgi:hypothetical protein
VQKLLEDRLKTSQSQVGDLLKRALSAFNEVLRKANGPIIVARVPGRQPTI